MNVEDVILKRIVKWRKEAVLYRTINIILFDFTKLGIPALSATVATNLSLSIVNNQFLSIFTMAWMTILITVLSCLDSLINPSDKKRLAFRTMNSLAELEEKLRIRLSNTSEVEKAPILEQASEELKGILDEYAKKGW